MDRSTLVYLIKETKTRDKNGVYQTETVRRPVYADVRSATAQDYFSGAQIGLRPDLTFSLFRYDYEDEEMVEYAGRVYAVYRTYIGRQGDTIELHTEKRVGRNG